MKKGYDVYTLKNCMTRKQRLKLKKKYKRVLKQIELRMKRYRNNAYFFERALLEARIDIIKKVNKERRINNGYKKDVRSTERTR